MFREHFLNKLCSLELLSSLLKCARHTSHTSRPPAVSALGRVRVACKSWVLPVALESSAVVLAWLTSNAGREACSKWMVECMSGFACLYGCLLEGLQGANILWCLLLSVEKAFRGSPESVGPWRKWRLWHELLPQ